MISLRNILKHTLLFIVVWTVIGAPSSAHANVVINSTRVIYSADENEASLRLNNISQQPSLVQVWLDAGDPRSTPETGTSPFMPIPPIFRVDPGKGQTVRIIYTPDSPPKTSLPKDKESVYWVNVLDVPPMPVIKNNVDANYMQLAIRSRIKLFFRPKELPGSPFEAAEKLRWELVQKEGSVMLRATNGAAFHVSLNEATLAQGNKNYAVNVDMVAPASSQEFLVRDFKNTSKEPLQLNYSTVNDYGSVVIHSIVVSFDAKQ